ncbi:small-conductance mechanosensitive channel [Microbacterium keratanolyticum]|nr:small-conductance mechanosensitive channel [Microbacterium keratanolyticum]
MDLVALELFFVGLLGLAGLAIAFVSGAVLVNLFRGQR